MFSSYLSSRSSDNSNSNLYCYQVNMSNHLITQLIIISNITTMKEQQYQTTRELVEEFEQPTEQSVLQGLTHYFLTPNMKKIPFLQLFTLPYQSSRSQEKQIHKFVNNSLNCFFYLYPFIRSQYNYHFPQQNFMEIVIHETATQKPIIIEQIIKSCQNNKRKILFTRYLGLASTLSEMLVKKLMNPRKVQKSMVNNVLTAICKYQHSVQYQQVLYITNKVVNIDQTDILVSHTQFRTKLLSKIYPNIVRKDKILLQLITKAMDQVFGEYLPSTSANQLFKLLNSDKMKPSLASNVTHQIIKHCTSATMKQILDLVIVWWVEGNDDYLLTDQIYFKTNLLVLMLRSMDKNQLIQYSREISMGIQRRMENLTSLYSGKKQIIQLVWSTLTQGLDIKQQNGLEVTEQLLVGEQHQNENHPEEQQVQCERIQPIIFENQSTKEQPEQRYQSQTQVMIGHLKPPRNLYDCILGLKNPSRTQITLQYLPIIIRQNPEDLVFSWNQLMRDICTDMNDQTLPTLVSLFVVRPTLFIDTIGQIFFRKETSLNDKIIFIKCLIDGIDELSSKPVEVQEQQHSQDFYFKKVTSKYYKQQADIPRKQPIKTRRWGHTRIAHERKNMLSSEINTNTSLVSLKIVDNDPFVNRFYEIANHLYFSIISKLSFISGFPKEKIISRPILRLLAVLTSHLRKQSQDFRKPYIKICDICTRVVDFLEKGSTEQKFIKQQKQSCIGVLEVLNKISLTMDSNAPVHILKDLEYCILKLKKMPEYGIMPIISMIQANIYTNYVESQH